MKKIICILLILGVSVSAFAEIKATGRAPQLGSPSNPNWQGLYNQFQQQLDNDFDAVIDEINKEIADLDLNLDSFAQSFGDAGVFGSHGAAQRNFSGYRLFNVSFGSIVGIKGDILTNNLDNELLNGNIGLSPQVVNAQIGLNTSLITKKPLYLGVRFGFMPNNINETINDALDDENMYFDMNTRVFGITANYQLIPRVSLMGLIVWRGVNIGTGFIYQNTTLGMGYSLETDTIYFSDTYTVSGYPVTYVAQINIDPSLRFNLDVTTYTIPIEAMTAVKLLFLNIPLGVGVDIAFGSSKMNLGVRSNIDATLQVAGTTLEDAEAGWVDLSVRSNQKPTVANFKLMTGLGLTFGPLYVDIPVTYYLNNDGLSAGVTVGVSF